MENTPENFQPNNNVNEENVEQRPKRPHPPRKKKKKDIINNSGQGDVPVVKLVTDKFNWGAFFFSWIWGIKYKKWIMLLIIPAYMIPFLGMILGFGLQIWFGINGNKWAWQSTRYKSIQEFHEIHKKWATAAVIIMIINIIATIGILLLSFQQGISQNMMSTQKQGFSIDSRTLDGNFNNKEVVVTLDGKNYYSTGSKGTINIDGRVTNGKTKYSSTYSQNEKNRQPKRNTYNPNQTFSVDLTKPYTGN